MNTRLTNPIKRLLLIGIMGLMLQGCISLLLQEPPTDTPPPTQTPHVVIITATPLPTEPPTSTPTPTSTPQPTEVAEVFDDSLSDIAPDTWGYLCLEEDECFFFYKALVDDPDDELDRPRSLPLIIGTRGETRNVEAVMLIMPEVVDVDEGYLFLVFKDRSGEHDAATSRILPVECDEDEICFSLIPGGFIEENDFYDDPSDPDDDWLSDELDLIENMLTHDELFMIAVSDEDHGFTGTVTLDGFQKKWDSLPGSTEPIATMEIAAPGSSANLINEVIYSFGNHIGVASSVAWSPDGARLASGDGFASVYIWDMETGYQIKSFSAYEEGGGVEGVSWSPTKNLIAGSVLDYKVHFWNPDTGEELYSTDPHPARIVSIAWSPDGTKVASGDDVGYLNIWDARNGKYIQGIDGREFFFSTNALHWHPEGTHLAWGGLDGNVWIWDLDDDYETLEGHKESIYALDFSPSGDRICSGSYDKRMIIWDVEEEEIIHDGKGHPAAIGTLAWSPDGEVIASGDNAGNIFLWKADTGEIIKMLFSHNGWVYDLAWSPDGTMLASAGDDGVVRVWGSKQ